MQRKRVDQREPIDVILLAGGSGGSMMPLAEFLPKAMLPLGNRSLIQRILESITAAKRFRTIHILIGHRFADLLRAHVELLRDAGRIQPSIEYITSSKNDPSPLWPIRARRDRIGGAFLLHCGDVVAPRLRYEKLVAAHSARRKESDVVGTLLLTQDHASEVGLVELDAQDLVARFREKPQRSDSWINSGIAVFEPSIFDYARTRKDQFFQHLVPEAIARGRKIGAYCYEGPWYHFQHLADYHAEHVDEDRRRKWLRRF